jgi:Ca-activated chloride channel family protein
VVYAGAAGMAIQHLEKKQTIMMRWKLNAGGSTAGGAGIELAYNRRKLIKGGNNR